MKITKKGLIARDPRNADVAWRGHMAELRKPT